MTREETVIEIAREVGFDLAGIAPLAPPPASARFLDWIERGMHGSMAYLEKNQDRIVDPTRLMPGGKSLLVLGLAHQRPAHEFAAGGRIARYALGRDYHNLMGQMQRKLARRLDQAGLGGRNRRGSDATPILERSHAARAGLGFESKAANLLHPRFGPWFFLGEIVLALDLEPTSAPTLGSCGTCTACLDACPTGAIVEAGRVDARRCISYLTIEHRGDIAPALREATGAWAFGCDVCSEVCPWGKKGESFAARFGLHPAIEHGGLVEWLEAGPELKAAIVGSPMRRAGRESLARNAAIALRHKPSDAGRRALLHALSFDPSVIVREAAGWALGHAHAADAGTHSALELAAKKEELSTAEPTLARWLGDDAGSVDAKSFRQPHGGRERPDS